MEMEASSSTAAESRPQTRQKRVLPLRSHRGGPGLGNDIDVMILESQTRKLDSPIIPADTPFEFAPSYTILRELRGIEERDIKTVAGESYFDRPDVLKSFREKEIIQTPECINISDIPSVGGRFRPRDAEMNEAIVDMSDAAFEKRHRKFETFEKRQRLREKEKLKHEQYKLKERIEQLNSTDSSAFLALPASSFSPAPEQHHNEESDGSGGHPNAVNGYIASAEGERRKQEMLEGAYLLEERYRILLPPDRVKKPTTAHSAENSIREGTSSIRTTTSRRQSPEKEESVDHRFEDNTVEKIPVLKIRVPPQSYKRNKRQAPSYTSSPSDLSDFSSDRLPKVLPTHISIEPPSKKRKTNSAKSTSKKAIDVAMLEESFNPSIAVLGDDSPGGPGTGAEEIDELADDTPVAVNARPKKRMKSILSEQPAAIQPRSPSPASSIPPIESISIALLPSPSVRSSNRPPKDCVLLREAKKTAGRAARPQRGATAFGYKIPDEVSMEIHYEIPARLIDEIFPTMGGHESCDVVD